MPDALIKLASLVLVVVFAWSAGAKVLRWSEWGSLLARYRLGRVSIALRWVVPIAEAATAFVLATGIAKPGAAAALALLAVFSAAVLRLRSIEGDRLPCGCFGRTERRDYRVTLARNAVLALLAAAVLLSGEVSLYDDVSMPSRDEAIPVALIVSGIVAALWLGVSVRRSFRRGS